MSSVTYSSSDTFLYHQYISILVNRSNFTLFFLTATCHPNHRAEKNLARYSSYILRHFLKFVKYIS